MLFLRYAFVLHFSLRVLFQDPLWPFSRTLSFIFLWLFVIKFASFAEPRVVSPSPQKHVHLKKNMSNKKMTTYVFLMSIVFDADDQLWQQKLFRLPLSHSALHYCSVSMNQIQCSGCSKFWASSATSCVRQPTSPGFVLVGPIIPGTSEFWSYKAN